MGKDNSFGYNVTKENSRFPLFQFQHTQNFHLPPALTNYQFFNSRKELSINEQTKRVYLPKVDQILTKYAFDAMAIYSTIAFIEMVDKLFTPNSKISVFINTKLEYAITLYSNLYQVPTVTPEIRTILSAYFNNEADGVLIPSFSLFLRFAQINKLKQSLLDLEKTYVESLKNEANLEDVKHYEPSPYQTNILFAPKKEEFAAPTKQWLITHQFDKVLNETSAQSFINSANSEILNDINVEFETNRAKALGLAANIISDPIFKMSLEDPRWNEYDETIKTEVAYYNQKFAGVSGYISLDWRMVKAMVWSEVMAGPAGNPKEWKERPMQIGITKGGVTDPGFPALKAGAENTDMIITPEFQNKLKQLTKWDGETNIKAGVAWLIRKAGGGQVEWNENKVDSPQILIYVLDDKGFKGIEEKLNTTIKNIEINNPGIDFKRANPGQEIKYQKAHKEKYISKWLDWRTAVFDYNGKGDSTYMGKFDNAYQIIISRDK